MNLGNLDLTTSAGKITVLKEKEKAEAYRKILNWISFNFKSFNKDEESLMRSHVQTAALLDVTTFLSIGIREIESEIEKNNLFAIINAIENDFHVDIAEMKKSAEKLNKIGKLMF